MNPVENAHGPKVDDELLMVEIVHPCEAAKIVPAVDCGGFDKDKGKEYPPGDDVAVEDGRWDGEGQDVGDIVLYRVSILGCEGDRGREAMVELVDMGIDGSDMKCSVGIVEEKFAQENAEDDLGCDLQERGHHVVEPKVVWESTPGSEYRKNEMDGRGEELVAQDDAETVP